MRVSSTCFQGWSDNERFFQTPEDSFPFKLKSITKVVVFAIGIFLPQYSPSNPFSCGTVRLSAHNASLAKNNMLLFPELVVSEMRQKGHFMVKGMSESYYFFLPMKLEIATICFLHFGRQVPLHHRPQVFSRVCCRHTSRAIKPAGTSHASVCSPCVGDRMTTGMGYAVRCWYFSYPG